ncbi:MAG: hypothetical protein IH606_07265 [Burkholderiales bacterium]|nr:hypothetical protein [Burkholderiales bacterium]
MSRWEEIGIEILSDQRAPDAWPACTDWATELRRNAGIADAVSPGSASATADLRHDPHLRPVLGQKHEFAKVGYRNAEIQWRLFGCELDLFKAHFKATRCRRCDFRCVNGCVRQQRMPTHSCAAEKWIRTENGLASAPRVGVTRNRFAHFFHCIGLENKFLRWSSDRASLHRQTFLFFADYLQHSRPAGPR